MLWQLLPEYTPWHAAEVAQRPRLAGLVVAVREEAKRRAATA